MSYHQKLAQIEEMRNAVMLTDLNIQLTDLLHSHLEMVILQCKNLGIAFPNLDRTIDLMKKEQALVNKILSITPSPEAKRSSFSPEDETEPETEKPLECGQMNFQFERSRRIPFFSRLQMRLGGRACYRVAGSDGESIQLLLIVLSTEFFQPSRQATKNACDCLNLVLCRNSWGLQRNNIPWPNIESLVCVD